MDYSYVRYQLEEVKLRISQMADSCGRKSQEIKLAAVSKTFPAEAVLAAYEAGHRIFAENRVQELAEKHSALPPGIEWHLIGHLQSNKASKAAAISDYIHSVDSDALLDRIDRASSENGKKLNILLEVNISGEDSKFGLDETSAMKCAEKACSLKNIRFSGLMTMAPYGAEECELRRIFSSLRNLRDRIENSLRIRLPELSMGMSGDYEAAIREGATILRIGTAIFGKRT